MPDARDWISRHANTNAITPSGMLMRKIQRQLAYSVSRPPASGAITGATSAGQTMNAIVRRSSLFGVSASTTRRPTGTIIAPPTPCRTRITTSSARLVLSAQPSDASVKSTIAVRKIRRAPNRIVSQPLTGIRTASVTRYAVMMSAVDVTGTWSDSAIFGVAVRTIVASRISMKKHPATSRAVMRRWRSFMVGARRASRHHITPRSPDAAPTDLRAVASPR